jgi:hypothetical protein
MYDAQVLDSVAEGVGFEPTVAFRLRLISSQVHSTTLPPFRCIENQRRTIAQIACLSKF